MESQEPERMDASPDCAGISPWQLQAVCPDDNSPLQRDAGRGRGRPSSSEATCDGEEGKLRTVGRTGRRVPCWTTRCNGARAAGFPPQKAAPVLRRLAGNSSKPLTRVPDLPGIVFSAPVVPGAIDEGGEVDFRTPPEEKLCLGVVEPGAVKLGADPDRGEVA